MFRLKMLQYTPSISAAARALGTLILNKFFSKSKVNALVFNVRNSFISIFSKIKIVYVTSFRGECCKFTGYGDCYIQSKLGLMSGTLVIVLIHYFGFPFTLKIFIGIILNIIYLNMFLILTIYSLLTTNILNEIDIFAILTNQEEIFKLVDMFMSKYNFFFLKFKFYVKNGVIDLNKFFGVRIFFYNSIRLLIVGLVIYIFKSISLGIIILLLLVFIIIIFMRRKSIKLKFYELYNEIINDMSDLLKINLFFNYVSLFITRGILLLLCEICLILFGDENMYIDFVIVLLTSTLFNYIFSIPGFIYPSLNLSFSLVDLETRNRIIDFLAERSGFDRNRIISDFDLSDRNMEALYELLDFKPFNNNRFVFSKNGHGLKALPERFYKFYKPVNNNLNYLSVFHRIGTFDTIHRAVNYLNMFNGRGVAIYDPKSKFLYYYVDKQFYTDYNRILYVFYNPRNADTSRVFKPYDPNCFPGADRVFYLRDLNGYYHPLNLFTEMYPGDDQFSNYFAKEIYMIKKYDNGQIKFLIKDKDYFASYFSSMSRFFCSSNESTRFL